MKSFQIILHLMILVLLGSCTGRNQVADATGTFEATEIIVSAEAAGKIMALNMNEGQLLQAGQETGYIDSVQLYLKKMQLLASQGAVKSKRPEVAKQIAVINQQIETALIERKRIENLLKSEAANRKQLDDINAQIAVLEKQLAALKSTLDITNRGITEEASVIDIQVAQLDDQLLKCRITVPISGTVLTKYAEAGELATVGKPLFKIADMENIFLRAYITSSQLSRVKLGQQVKLLADEGEKNYREYQGVIAWISDKAEFTPKTIQTRDERANLVYAVRITVKNDGYLKLGMYGQIDLPSAE